MNMEIKGFREYLYLFKKTYNFKKVYANYGSDSYKEVLWLVKKRNKIKDADLYSFHKHPNIIIEDYKFDTDYSIDSLYVVQNIKNGKVMFRPAIEVWIEVAYKIVTFNGISNKHKIEKVLNILQQIPKDKWESFLIRFVYSFNNSQFNSFLLAFLVEISQFLIKDDLVYVEQHKPIFPKICQFNDKFSFRFTKEEVILLWINLIETHKDYILNSIDTHGIAHYLIETLETPEIEQLYSFFPLIEEKSKITNNEDSPFDFERANIHKRHLFEFHNEQMTKNICHNESDTAWVYKAFKDIADLYLTQMSIAYHTQKPYFISKENDPIYSAIIYAESPEQVNLFSEILFQLIKFIFTEVKMNKNNKDKILEFSNFQCLNDKVMIRHYMKYKSNDNEDLYNLGDEFKI